MHAYMTSIEASKDDAPITLRLHSWHCSQQNRLFLFLILQYIYSITSIYVPTAYNIQGTTVPCDNNIILYVIGFINDEAPKNNMIHSVALLLLLFVALKYMYQESIEQGRMKHLNCCSIYNAMNGVLYMYSTCIKLHS